VIPVDFDFCVEALIVLKYNDAFSLHRAKYLGYFVLFSIAGPSVVLCVHATAVVNRRQI